MDEDTPRSVCSVFAPAFTAGREAYTAGQRASANPYARTAGDDHFHWHQGWASAERDARGNEAA